MPFTEKQARAKAQQIHDRFGLLIHEACIGSGVEDSFLAGFTGVEAGIDHHGQIDPYATRFEPGVYKDLISLRDNGYCFINGRKCSTYSGVRREQIADSDDAAIRALSISYGFSQIMGWHVINNLKCTIADLRDLNKHFHYTVLLLKIVGGKYMQRGDLVSVLHIWNTGNANGKTYHEDYVTNALAVKEQYEHLKVSAAAATSPELVPPSSGPVNDVEPSPEGQALPSDVPQAQPPTQDDPAGQPFVADTKTIDAPPAEQTTAKTAGMTIAGIAVPGFLVAFIHAIQSAIANGYIDTKDVGNAVLSFITNNTKYVFVGVGLVIVSMILGKAYKQASFLLQMWINASPNMHDVVIRKQ